MAEITVCRKDSYYDSVTLMTLSSKLKKLDGITDAVVSMATPMNKDLLENIGMLCGDLIDAGPNDLAIAIRGENDEVCRVAFESIDILMQSKSNSKTEQPESFRSIADAAVKSGPYDLAVISVKGDFAAREAHKALKHDMHVMLFSDNVTVEEELELKTIAHEKNLLVMGPDCGTAILGGVGLCFSNEMRSGNIGLVAASGTGLQEACVLIDRLGAGITQAIGTGGRDLSEAIGGIMMLDGIDLLDNDEATEVIVVVSKPPAPSIANEIIDRLSQSTKPVVVCFIADREREAVGGLHFATSLEDAAYKAVALSDGNDLDESVGTRFPVDESVVVQAAAKLDAEQAYIRGLFCGGTLAAEALFECSKVLSKTMSNESKELGLKMEDPFVSESNCIVDLGDDVFTVGRPHPMIEPDLRCERIVQEASDPTCAVILLDFEIGYGSNADPVGATLDAIARAHDVRHSLSGDIVFVGYVQGTEGDTQGLEAQRAKLAEAGVIVAESNLHAITIALRILDAKGGR